jgi:hypothetical protein
MFKPQIDHYDFPNYSFPSIEAQQYFFLGVQALPISSPTILGVYGSKKTSYPCNGVIILYSKLLLIQYFFKN